MLQGIKDLKWCTVNLTTPAFRGIRAAMPQGTGNKLIPIQTFFK